jgi:hypothetical protein
VKSFLLAIGSPEVKGQIIIVSALFSLDSQSASGGKSHIHASQYVKGIDVFQSENKANKSGFFIAGAKANRKTIPSWKLLGKVGNTLAVDLKIFWNPNFTITSDNIPPDSAPILSPAWGCRAAG